MNAPDYLPADLTPLPPATASRSRALAVVVALGKWIAAVVGLMLMPQIFYVAWVVIANGGTLPGLMQMLPPWWLFLGAALPALLLLRHPWRADASSLAAAPWRNLGWLLLPMVTGQTLGWLGQVAGVPREALMVMLGEEMARQPHWGLLAAIVLCAPLLEEAIFRGLAWRWLRPACGRWVTIVVSTLVFIGFHAGQYGAFGMALVTCLALTFAAIRERTGSLVLCVAGHALANGAAMAVVVAG